MTELPALAWRVAADTAAYLFAYGFAPAWALAAAIALFLVGRRVRPERWLSSDGGARFGAALLLGLLRPYGRRGVEASLGRLEGTGTLPVAGYLAVSHGFLPYYLILLGPLLGKDVLLSHAIGGLWFVPAAAALARLLGAAGEGRPARGPQATGSARAGSDACGKRDFETSGLRIAAGEVGRATVFGAYGLALGGLIGALGLLDPSRLLVGPEGGRALTQAGHALLGAALAPLAFTWPVTNLFVGTYLWKVGLAHAGLVAFFYAATASPQRIRVYRRLWGRRAALRWTAALAGAAVLAGLGTALVYGLTDLGIRYKLSPAQMWTW